MPNKACTRRWDSGAIPSLFLRLSIFPVGRLRRPRPSAGNANRWALARKKESRFGLLTNIIAGYHGKSLNNIFSLNT